jgi:hypothetical protein
MLLAFALLFSNCATAGSERVHVVIFNDDSRQHTIRIDVDGQPFFNGTVATTPIEPSIVSSIDSRLPPGRHHVEVICDNVRRSIEFEVRHGTRSNLHIRVKAGTVEVDVAYGNLVYI